MKTKDQWSLSFEEFQTVTTLRGLFCEAIDRGWDSDELRIAYDTASLVACEELPLMAFLRGVLAGTFDQFLFMIVTVWAARSMNESSRRLILIGGIQLQSAARAGHPDA